MITLYHAPRTRSVRVLWLLEELGVPYELRRVEFVRPTEGFFAQATPLGKLPVIEDEGRVLCESGAILEYLTERHGGGRLAPPPGSPQRGRFLQWLHYAEGTLAQPLSSLLWHGLYKGDAEHVPDVVEDARARAAQALDFLADQFGEGPYLLGAELSAADIMIAFTLVSAQVLGVLDERSPVLQAYLSRLQERPAFQKAIAS